MLKLEAFVAEFIGTFTLIFIGVGAIAVRFSVDANNDVVWVALAHGLAIAVMVSATAAVSGGHLNPAVTFAALIAGKIKPIPAAGYFAAQLLGGVAAAYLLRVAMPVQYLDGMVAMGVPRLGPNVTMTMGVIMEAVLTFFLVFVVFGTGIDQRGPKIGGLYIGLTVTMAILAAGRISGGCMNPARHLGPAIVSNHMEASWVWWVGPLVGAFLAAIVYRFVMEAGVKKTY